ELLGPDGRTVVQWCGGEFGGETPVVSEEGKYGLVIHDADPDASYAIAVGEERIDAECRAFSFGCELAKGAYFESAFAKTAFSVMRQAGDESAEEKVAECELYVLPSKIGHENYQRMVGDLQKVCRSLINDLIGKSRHGQDWDDAFQPVLFRSMEEELTAIRRTWAELAPLIEEISVAPATRTVIKHTMASVGRNRSYRGIAAMMKKGVDPRNASPGRKCPTFRLKESVDVPEHRLIKGFMSFLLMRLRKCHDGVNGDIEGIESDKRYRSKPPAPEAISLYELEDVPKLRKLRRYARRIDDLCGGIQGILLSGFWRDLAEEVEYPVPGKFSESACYIEIANIILRYLRDGLNTGEMVGEDFMTKKTSRMYEQWILIQLVTAMERCGLDIETWESVIRRSVSSQFGLDFKKNTRFLAKLDGPYSVLLRYEPWILPRNMLSMHEEETLCHFESNDSFWNPDFMIELVKRENGANKTIYAVALDAKYSRKPGTDMRSGVSKYAKIRSNDGRRCRQVARQVWLVYPGAEEMPQGILVEDKAVDFLPSFGPVYADSNDSVLFDEVIKGDVILRPDSPGEMQEEVATERHEDSHGIVPRKVMLDFVRGTLEYFRQYIKESE
ncbi:MAG: DUF2357 domain-containing protein, partial [Kiritimatiellae bacterium]|nr:DUF2357 domain-containing protein [Kiritimatiellia bacterium]